MIDRSDAIPSPTAADSYSPQRRTALVLIGTGTAGAYHAGVLRALHEAGVKIDVVAGRGIGGVGALFAAVDGGQRLWDEKGFWRAWAVRKFYPWRHVLRRRTVEATDAPRPRATIYGAVGRESRAAGISRAPHRRPRSGRTSRSRVRAGGRVAAPRSPPTAHDPGRREPAGRARRPLRART